MKLFRTVVVFLCLSAPYVQAGESGDHARWIGSVNNDWTNPLNWASNTPGNSVVADLGDDAALFNLNLQATSQRVQRLVFLSTNNNYTLTNGILGTAESGIFAAAGPTVHDLYVDYAKIGVSIQMPINIGNGSAIRMIGSVRDGIGIEKLGGGNLHLHGSNTFTLGTTISGGRLFANHPATSLGTGAVIIAGGELSGTGRVDAAVSINYGNIAPGESIGSLSLKSLYSDPFDSDLKFELGGTSAGSYDTLIIDGEFTAGNYLSLKYTNGFTAAAGDSFQIIQAGTVIGVFTNIIYPDNDPRWVTLYNSNSISVLKSEAEISVNNDWGLAVDYTQDCILLSGTSSNISGSLVWVNDTTGNFDTMDGGTTWTSSCIALDVGLNYIGIYGTNDMGGGFVTNVVVKRLSQINTRLTVYYDFEGDFLDHPGAGVTNDDLNTVKGGYLTNDVSASALGSTMSYYFDNSTNDHMVAHTDQWSPDLASADQYTIMYWFKGDDLLQRGNNTRLITVRQKADGSDAGAPGFQVEGFGGGNPGNTMDTRLFDPYNSTIGAYPLWFTRDAAGALSYDGNPDNDVWNHVVFILSNRDGPTTGNAYNQTYVNGVLIGTIEQASGSFGSAPPESTGNLIGNTNGVLCLGGLVSGNGLGATGFLDDFALFEGVVPSNIIAEIAAGTRSPADTFTPYVQSITPSTTLTNSGPLDFTVVFSGPVTNFDDISDLVIGTSGISVTGATFTGSGAYYTVTLTGISGDGTLTLAVSTNSNVETDPPGSGFLKSSVTSPAVSIDTTPPMVSLITVQHENPTTRTEIELLVTFTEPVTNFNNGTDISIVQSGTTNSGILLLPEPDGINYGLKVLGVGGEGSFILGITADGGITDPAGNALVTNATDVLVFHNNDFIAPTIDSIVPDRLYVANTGTYMFVNLIFSETIANLDANLKLLTTGFEYTPVTCVGCPPPGTPLPPGDISYSQYSVLVENFRLLDGMTGGTFSVTFDNPNGITDLAGNPLANIITSATIQVSATPFQQWAYAYSLPLQSGGGGGEASGGGDPVYSYWNPFGDPDFDGEENFIEFMRNTNPTSNVNVLNRRLLPLDINGTNYFTLTLPAPAGVNFFSYTNTFIEIEYYDGWWWFYDDFTGSTNLITQNISVGGASVTSVVPAVDGPVTGYPSLPGLPDSHQYITIQLGEETDFGAIWIDTFED